MADYTVTPAAGNNYGGDITPIFPVGSGVGNWPTGGQAAGNNSYNPLTSGQDNASYWLPIWSGEVINAYDQYNIFEPMVTTETIESGTTKRFPITGTVSHKGVWNAGEELIGSESIDNPGWFDISLDQRPMAAYFELDDIHLMLTQWDYRAELARQAGLQLSYIRDKQIACMIAQAAFTANRQPFNSTYCGMNHANNLVLAPNAKFNFLGNRNATATARADAALLLLDYLERYMVRLSEIDATMGEVYCAVTPQAFHDIRALGIARDATGLVGGAGRPFFGGVSEAGGLGAPLTQNMFGISEVLEYMGVKIVKSNHLSDLDHAKVEKGLTNNPALNISTVAATAGQYLNANTAEVPVIGDLGDAKYNFGWFDGSLLNTSTGLLADTIVADTGVVQATQTMKPVKALIWQKSAVCSLRLQGMKVETVKDVRRGTFFTVSSIMAGAGILRPELVGAIQGTYST
jgi:hypothetical protein